MRQRTAATGVLQCPNTTNYSDAAVQPLKGAINSAVFLPQVLFLPLSEGSLGLLPNLVDAKEVLVEGFDSLGPRTCRAFVTYPSRAQARQRSWRTMLAFVLPASSLWERKTLSSLDLPLVGLAGLVVRPDDLGRGRGLQLVRAGRSRVLNFLGSASECFAAASSSPSCGTSARHLEVVGSIGKELVDRLCCVLRELSQIREGGAVRGLLALAS